MRVLLFLLMLVGSAQAQMVGGIMQSQSRIATSLGAPYVLCQSAISVSAPADTTEDVLYTCSVPGGMMGPNGRIRVTTIFTVNNTADAKTIRVRLGGASGTAIATRNLANNVSDYRQVTAANRNSASSQIAPGAALAAGGWGSGTGGNTTATINTVATTTVVVTCQKATAGDTCTLEDVLVELIYGA